MDRYLITYEYKEKNGCLVTVKTKTTIFTLEELEDLPENNTSYEKYIRILFCQKL